jgi:hypothetical protein
MPGIPGGAQRRLPAMLLLRGLLHIEDLVHDPPLAIDIEE